MQGHRVGRSDGLIAHDIQVRAFGRAPGTMDQICGAERRAAHDESCRHLRLRPDAQATAQEVRLARTEAAIERFPV